MNFQSSDKSKHQNSNIDEGKSIWVDGYRENQGLEIRRRIQDLHIRREHLEKELQEVRNGLLSLDAHMHNEEAYRQLVIGK